MVKLIKSIGSIDEMRGRAASCMPDWPLHTQDRSKAQIAYQDFSGSWKRGRPWHSKKARWNTRRCNEPLSEIDRKTLADRLGLVFVPAIIAELYVCESYTADIRAGRRRPHLRHWETRRNLSTQRCAKLQMCTCGAESRCYHLSENCPTVH